MRSTRTASSRAYLAATALAVCGAIGAACDDAGPEQDQAAEAPAPEPSPYVGLEMPPSSSPDQPPGTIDPGAEGEVVPVRATEDGLVLERDSVPAGQVTVRLENGQAEPCALLVRARTGAEWRSLPAGQGATASLSMVLPRARYTLTCELAGSGAALAGDTARLTVHQP